MRGTIVAMHPLITVCVRIERLTQNPNPGTIMIKAEIKRRQFIRYPVPDNEFFVYSHDSNTMVTIRDISLGGLKIEYFQAAFDTFNWKLIDIFVESRRHFHLPGIPCKTVYDIGVLAENQTFSGSPCRLCGLKYEILSERQKTMLQALLDNFVRERWSPKNTLPEWHRYS
jgi:hypothetical protein